MVRFSDACIWQTEALIKQFITSLFVWLAMLPAAAHADDETAYFQPLSGIEIKRQILVETTLYFDYLQTIDIKNHPGMFEKNIILGLHPKDNRVTVYFLLAGAAHYGVTRALPTEYRAPWQYTWIALEAATILHNKKIGLHFNF
jgi:hypothetical protein